MDNDDWKLVREYAAENSERAFHELVRRYAGLVHASAFRQTGDAQLAQDVAQAVFTLLSRKARSLRPETVLSGWLFQTTRFVANRALRAEQRRRRREQEAFNMRQLQSGEDAWRQNGAGHRRGRRRSVGGRSGSDSFAAFRGPHRTGSWRGAWDFRGRREETPGSRPGKTAAHSQSQWGGALDGAARRDFVRTGGWGSFRFPGDCLGDRSVEGRRRSRGGPGERMH